MDTLHISTTFIIAFISWVVGLVGVYVSLHNRVTRLETKFEEQTNQLGRIIKQLDDMQALVQSALIKLETKQNRP